MEEVEQASDGALKHARKWVRRIARVMLGLLLLLIFTSVLGLFILPFHLVFGWVGHLQTTLPVLLPRWRELLLPLGCLVVAIGLLHRFIRWWLATKGSATGWKPGHTVSFSTLLLLGSAAAIAMSGIVHQAVWLMDEPWYERRGMDIVRATTMNSAKQILFAVEEFHASQGRYPDSLAELPLPASLITAAPRSNGATEPFVYFKPKPEDLTDEEVLLLVSPVLRSDGRFIAAFSNGRINVMPGEEFPILLETRRMPKREKP